MSTPRTDAAAKKVRSTENGILVRAEFARELERENAALTKDVCDLVHKNEELLKNKERLIEAAQLALDTIVCGHRHGFEPNSGAYALPRLRAAIDAARKEAQP